MGDLENEPSQRRSECCSEGGGCKQLARGLLKVQGQLRTRDEDCRAKGQLFALEKETHVKRNPSERSLADPQERTQAYEDGIRRRHGLQRRRDAPCKDGARDENMRWDDAEEQRHPFKGDVCEVESREAPFVPAFAAGNGL